MVEPWMRSSRALGGFASEISVIPRSAATRNLGAGSREIPRVPRTSRGDARDDKRDEMMRLPKFRYYSTRTIADAVAIRADAGPEGAYVAGGTDLYPNMKRRQQTPKVLVGLSRIPELASVGERGDGRLSLGAGLLLCDVEHDPRVGRS